MVVKTLIVDTMPRQQDGAVAQDGGVLHSSKGDPPEPPQPMDFEKPRPARNRRPRRQRGIPKGMEGNYYLA